MFMDFASCAKVKPIMGYIGTITLCNRSAHDIAAATEKPNRD